MGPGPNCAFRGAGLGPFGSLPAQNGATSMGQRGPDWGSHDTLASSTRSLEDPFTRNRVTTRGSAGPSARWPAGPLARWPVGPLGSWAVGPLGSLEPCGPRVLVHGGSLGGRRGPKLVNELMSLLSTKHKPQNGTYRTYSKVPFCCFPLTARSCVSSWHLWPWYRRFQLPPCSGDPSCVWPCGKRQC